MSLAPGDKLGPYEILALIGTGGMGRVYRAHDPRMGRDVAIKVCAEHFSERFDREVRAVAALNHPNICTVHDVGPNYLLMELVEGESPRGPLPLETALDYARQIAAALEAAHEKGIVHRDLKPANIRIKPDNTVKVLDFGLAKIEASFPVHSEDSPTLSIAATRAGVILGTAAYMSPEQAKGKPVDKRADIWAFGVVLYEMLTGVRLFQGEDLTETLAAVVKETPDLSKVPPQVRKLLESCLEKDPRKRLRDIGDVWRMLDAPPSPAASRPARPSAWAAAAVLAIVAAVGWLRQAPGIGESPGFTLTIVPPNGAQLPDVGNLASAPEIAPDGSAVMFRASGGLYIRSLDSLTPRLVPGSEAVSNASFWSADSASVVFPIVNQLMKVRLPDGAPQPIAPLTQPTRGGSWSDNGTVLISAGNQLHAAPASGGELKPVEAPGLAQGGYLNPEFLPGVEDFLFLFVPGDNHDDSAIYLATLRGGKAEDLVLLLKNPTAARFTPEGGGRILYVRNDNLYSQKFSRSARKLEGEAELVAQGVASQPAMNVNRGDFSVARNGAVAWRAGKAALSQITVFDRQGKAIATAGSPGSVDSVVLSPDETRVLASTDRHWIMDVGQPGRLALPDAQQWFGWSPDGSKLLGRRGQEFVEMPAAGSGEVRQSGHLARGGGRIHDISPDGKHVLGVLSLVQRIFYARLQGTAEEMSPQQLVTTGDAVYDPRFSPDGRWIVYGARDGSSGAGLFVQPFPGPGKRSQIASGGADPAWRRDGKEILYSAGDRLMSVSVSAAGSDLRFGAPQLLFSGLRQPAGTNASARPLAVSRDGSRIYWPQAVAQPGSDSIHIKTGWIQPSGK